MSDTPKVDVSREAVAKWARGCDEDTAMRLLSLLDAKEAAERISARYLTEAETAEAMLLTCRKERDEARASAAAAWEAAVGLCAMHVEAGIYLGSDGNGNVKTKPMTGAYLRTVQCIDLSATDALRHVKEQVWDEGFRAGEGDAEWQDKTPNPYRKEADNG